MISGTQVKQTVRTYFEAAARVIELSARDGIVEQSFINRAGIVGIADDTDYSAGRCPIVQTIVNIDVAVAGETRIQIHSRGPAFAPDCHSGKVEHWPSLKAGAGDDANPSRLLGEEQPPIGRKNHGPGGLEFGGNVFRRKHLLCSRGSGTGRSPSGRRHGRRCTATATGQET